MRMTKGEETRLKNLTKKSLLEELKAVEKVHLKRLKLKKKQDEESKVSQ